MANRSDRRFPNLSGEQGLRGRCSAIGENVRISIMARSGQCFIERPNTCPQPDPSEQIGTNSLARGAGSIHAPWISSHGARYEVANGRRTTTGRKASSAPALSCCLPRLPSPPGVRYALHSRTDRVGQLVADDSSALSLSTSVEF